MWIFYFLFWTAVRASADEPIYRKIGDEAVLTPNSVENPITNIRWKHGPNIAMEWYGGKTESYQQFKDHGSLNILTGVMTITGLTRDLRGIYTAEINNEVNSQTQLLVISAVPKPTITVSCDPERTYCDLTCDGSTTGAEPVTYRWTSGDKERTSTKELKITKEEEEEWISCELDNPVSSNRSEKVLNPLLKKPLYKKIGDEAVLTPDSVENPITYIRWKHGPDIAMEWRGDEIISYRQFKDRGSLNISTGVMTITGLTRDHSGNYTAEINNRVTSKTQLLVISPVPKPSISVLCEMTHCVFSCDGNITGAEPVTYWWTAGEKRWRSTDKHKITKEELEKSFSCTLENPVSSQRSDNVFNPHMEYIPHVENNWRLMFILTLVVVGVILFGGIIYFRRKHKKGPGEAVDRTRQEMGEMLPNLHGNSNVASQAAADSQASKPQWQYTGENEGWFDFRETTDTPNECSVTNNEIEKWYQEKPHVNMTFMVKGDICVLDFNKMIQINTKEKTDHKIRRVLL